MMQSRKVYQNTFMIEAVRPNHKFGFRSHAQPVAASKEPFVRFGFNSPQEPIKPPLRSIVDEA